MKAAAELRRRSGRGLVARSVAVDDPGDLLARYDGTGFAWFDGDAGFVTSGTAAVVAPGDAHAFLAAIDHDADGDAPAAAGPRAVGALPFSGDGRLVVPARVTGRDRGGRAWQTTVEGPDVVVLPSASRRPGSDPLAPAHFAVGATTTREDWRAGVRAALDGIAAHRLDKVVLARAVTVDADAPFDLVAVLATLRRAQRGCIVYADRGLVGASPELLVRKDGAHVTSRPLAGTGTDREALARSAKDAHEHRLVVDAVVDALRAAAVDVVATGPAPIALADVCHLATTVTAHLRDPAVSVLDLVRLLHPTPAVGGTPRAAALDTIAACEPVARGRYAGPCGWVDARGDGEFVVALRGGEIDGAHAVLHAGAGIVAGSDPDAEWAETQQKLTPMLQALVRP